MAVMAQQYTWTPKRIKALRTALKLTQAAAAEKVGVGQAVWAAWERSLRSPSGQSKLLLNMLAKANKINPEDL